MFTAHQPMLVRRRAVRHSAGSRRCKRREEGEEEEEVVEPKEEPAEGERSIFGLCWERGREKVIG